MGVGAQGGHHHHHHHHGAEGAQASGRAVTHRSQGQGASHTLVSIHERSSTSTGAGTRRTRMDLAGHALPSTPVADGTVEDVEEDEDGDTDEGTPALATAGSAAHGSGAFPPGTARSGGGGGGGGLTSRSHPMHRDSHPALEAELHKAGLRVPSAGRHGLRIASMPVGLGLGPSSSSSSSSAPSSDRPGSASGQGTSVGGRFRLGFFRPHASGASMGGDGSPSVSVRSGGTARGAIPPVPIGPDGLALATRARSSSDDAAHSARGLPSSPHEALASPKHTARGLSAAAVTSSYTPPALTLGATGGGAGGSLQPPTSPGRGLGRIKASEMEDLTAGKGVSTHATVVSALAQAASSARRSTVIASDASAAAAATAAPYPSAGFSSTLGTGTGTGMGHPSHPTRAVSEIGSSLAMDPAAAEYVAAHWSLYGPSTHGLQAPAQVPAPPPRLSAADTGVGAPPVSGRRSGSGLPLPPGRIDSTSTSTASNASP